MSRHVHRIAGRVLRPGRPPGPRRRPAGRGRRIRRTAGICLSIGVLGVSAFPSLHARLPWQAPAGHSAAAPGTGHPAPSPPPSGSAERTVLDRLPDIGPQFQAAIPEDSRQVLLVEGDDVNSPASTATLWTRDAEGRWSAGATWGAHNALRGWTADHWAGDLRSPIGVFGLTGAGGLAPDPGTRLPYLQSPAFRTAGAGFEGEPLEGAFDYVVAIDYNRVPGTSPLDRRLPLGPSRGAGLWVHVDHDGPTHGCVSLKREDMIELLRSLDPADHPVIVMGDRASLAH